MKERTHIDEEFGQVLLKRHAGSRYIRLRVNRCPAFAGHDEKGNGAGHDERGKGAGYDERPQIVVTLPWLASWQAGVAFFESKREWIRKTLARQEKRQAQYGATDPPVVDDAYIASLRAEAKRTLPPKLAELAAQHGFQYNKVFIKHNRSNWGSCSTRGNINLNLNIIRLPQHLQDYILLHELVHLKEMNHSPRFHALLEEVCPGHRALQKEMRAWRLV